MRLAAFDGVDRIGWVIGSVARELVIFAFSKFTGAGAVLALGIQSLVSVAVGANSDAESVAKDWYRGTDDQMAAVEQVLNDADARGTYALIVLGANWCHDSRALAERLQQEPLSQLVQTRYATALIDVGYYEHGFDVMEAFGQPIYYATPTVLIVDPATRRLVNADNRHQWGNAYNISMQESVDYFSLMAAAPLPLAEKMVDLLSRHAQEIKAWEAQAAQRVAAAYKTYGPLLEAYASGGEKVPSRFRERFREFSRFRMAIPEGLVSLQNQARNAAQAGRSAAELEYPALPEFSIAEANP